LWHSWIELNRVQFRWIIILDAERFRLVEFSFSSGSPAGESTSDLPVA